MAISLSDRELDAMDGLPHFHRCVYIFGIRKYMDYQTGITGIKREISYKSLAEEVYVKPHQGVKDTGNNSRDQIKRVLILLEKKGLISRHSIVTKDEKQLILKCLLANADNSIQNKAAPKPPHSAAPQTAPVDNSKNTVKIDTSANMAQESRPESRPAQNEKGAPHPISDTLHNITLASAHDFFQLLAQQGYYINQLHSNKKTLAMVHAWVKAKVTLEEAQIGINHVNGQLGQPPDTPTYYNKPVLQVRQDFKSAQQLSEEMTSNETNRPRPISESKADSRRNRYKKILR
jgi:hypothetical protein